MVTGDGGRSIGGGSFLAQLARTRPKLHIKTNDLPRRDINLLSLLEGMNSMRPYIIRYLLCDVSGFLMVIKILYQITGVRRKTPVSQQDNGLQARSNF